jgi:lysophospholipase L1-like esterase
MKIVFLGDSLTAGRYGGDFVGEVARLLPDHEIINGGVGGSTVINLLNRLDEVFDLAPDGVFVMTGGNDAISTSQPETRSYYRLTRGAPDGRMTPEIFARTYRELLTRLQLHYVQTWAGLESTEYSAALSGVLAQLNTRAAAEARALNVPVFDMAAHFPPGTQPEHTPLTEESIALIGKRVRAGWSDYETERQRGGFTWSFDGMHITPETARRLAAAIVDFLDL